MSTIVFYGQFTNSGQGATGLTVTVDVVRITRSTGVQTTSVTAGSATEITAPNARGVYLYQLAGADLTLYDYVATFITTGTADLKHVPALYTPVAADLISIIQTILTESSAGLLAAAFKKLFDVPTPTLTASSITFTIAGQVDANIQYVNDVQVNGIGTSGSPWGP